MIPEQPVSLTAGLGVTLDGAVTVPPGAKAGVVICHPHPLYGGDMDNPVVLTVFDACRRAGMATLRFNFRGTGRSTGAHDEGCGERDDVRAAVAELTRRLGTGGAVSVAGYSFGGAVATSVAMSGDRLAGLALIAPPLVVAAYRPVAPLPAVDGPVLVVAGTADEYCPVEALEALRTRWPHAAVHVVDGANHFFAGRHAALARALETWAVAVRG